MCDHTQKPIARSNGLDPLEPRLLFCATTAISADLSSDMIAQWSFDGAAAAAADDVSGQAADHDASLSSGAYRTSDALCGRGGMRFAGGASEMLIPNHSEINLATQGQRTISLWFNADNIEIGSRRQFLYEEGGTSRGLSIYLYNGELFAGGWNRVGSESDWDGTWFSTDQIVSGGWHHVVLTLDGGSTVAPNALNTYLDGQLFGSGEGSQLWGHAGDITFGNGTDTRLANGNTSSGTNGFAGWIDDARLYNRALSGHDIAVLSGRFNEGAAITLARAARLDLVAEAEPISEPVAERSQELAVEAAVLAPGGFDVLTEARPIAFPTADDDKTAPPDAVIDTEGEAAEQEGATQSSVDQSAKPEAASEEAQPRHAAAEPDDAASATGNAEDPNAGQSTAHVDEPKHHDARHDKRRRSELNRPAQAPQSLLKHWLHRP